MLKKNSFYNYDKFEKKFVFKMSRTIFLLMSFLAIISITISIFMFIYSITPTIKKTVLKEEYPKSPIVSYDEIDNQINSLTQKLQSNQKIQFPEDQKKIKTTIAQIKKTQLDDLLDSLKAYFSTSWEDAYNTIPLERDYFGRITESRKILLKQGLKNKLDTILIYCQEDSAKVRVVKNILAIIKKFQIEKRELAFTVYLSIMKNKLDNYDNAKREIDDKYSEQITLTETKYFQSKIEKDLLESRSITIFGAGIISLALIGLNLSFLAIERNTRSIKELIVQGGEKDGV